MGDRSDAVFPGLRMTFVMTNTIQRYSCPPDVKARARLREGQFKAIAHGIGEPIKASLLPFHRQ